MPSFYIEMKRSSGGLRGGLVVADSASEALDTFYWDAGEHEPDAEFKDSFIQKLSAEQSSEIFKLIKRRAWRGWKGTRIAERGRVRNA